MNIPESVKRFAKPIGAAAIALVLVGGTALAWPLWADQEDTAAASREETVKRGDLTVGITEAGTATLDGAHNLDARDLTSVEVAAEMECPGHSPQLPRLHYLQKEPSIQTLVALRMDETSPISHQKYTLKLSNSSGIKEKDAAKIDMALKGMKIKGNTTMSSEFLNESRRYLEYEIDF